MLISSVSGFEVDFAAGSYGAMKAALIHYAKGLSRQLVGKGIRVNCVSPGNTYFDGGIWQNIEKNMPDLFAVDAQGQSDRQVRHGGGGRQRRGLHLEPDGEPHLGHQPRDRRRPHGRRLGASSMHSHRQAYDPSGSHPSRLEQRLPAGRSRSRRARPSQFETKDASSGQLSKTSTAADLAKLDLAFVNPVTGPVFIDGAQPGDAVKVTVLSFKPSGWGWTGNIPGFGLLADQFPERAAASLELRPGLTPAMYGPGGRVPLRPFPGTIGVAPAAPGLHSIVPPRNVGGNMDVRDIVEGVELYLPVEVDGALFSVGDTHAAQGDGEVCGTAIESPIDVALKFELVKGANLKMPRYVTPGPVTDHFDKKGYEVTTGIGPDLMTGARTAVSEMIDLLSKRYGYSAIDAYMLCSVCADLRISSIVDVPNWVVSFYFPRIVLE